MRSVFLVAMIAGGTGLGAFFVGACPAHPPASPPASIPAALAGCLYCEPPPVLAVSAEALEFGTVEIGSSWSRSFTITNDGGGTLAGTVRLGGIDAYGFDLSAVSFELLEGEKKTIRVGFFPEDLREFEARVGIESSGGRTSVSVGGSGVFRELSPLPRNEVGQIGLWPDEIIFREVADSYEGFDLLDSGEVQLYGGTLPEDCYWSAYERLTGLWSLGRAVELLLNPASEDGEPFFANGQLNPFALAEVRQAVSRLIDRQFLVEEMMDEFNGLRVPRWTVLDPYFSVYAEAIDACTQIELDFAYDEARAREEIAQAMQAAGAELSWGEWTYYSDPVSIVALIPEDDERIFVGDYIASQLELAGFRVERLHLTSAEIAASYLTTDPHEGRWGFAIVRWAKSAVDRDPEDDFDELYTERGSVSALRSCYQERLPCEADEVFARLARCDYETSDERVELLGEAETCAQELAWHQWLYSEGPLSVCSTRIAVLDDLSAGISDSYLWGHTIRYVDADGEPISGGEIELAMPGLMVGPWNPIAGSTASSDRMIQRATEDWFMYPDPNTGLYLPHLVHSAECFVVEGTPMSATYDFVAVVPVDEIEVPEDAWVGWDACWQTLLTRGDLYPDGLTARTRTVCKFSDDLFENLWHDGSRFSLADLVMHFIMIFDRAYDSSEIFDEAQISRFEQLLGGFKGARILAEDPLVIEVYDDRFCKDAENQVFERIGELFWPYYGSGMAPWHAIAVGNLVERLGYFSYSSKKAYEIGADQQDWVSDTSMWAYDEALAEAESSGSVPFVPYEAEMLRWMEWDGVSERYANLREFFDTHGHLWVGNGPMQIDWVDAESGIVVGTRFEEYRHDMGEWLVWLRDYDGPWIQLGSQWLVEAGDELGFDIELFHILSTEPYPVDDIAEIKYVVIDASGESVLSGSADVIADGTARIVLSGSNTRYLEPGTATLRVAAILRSSPLTASKQYSFEVE